MKKTKIICTIGPKTESISMIKKLIINGMDIARLNLSHGDYKEHYKRIKNIRYVSKLINKKIYILLDTKGPEIRTMNFNKKSEIFLKKNQLFGLSTKLIDGDENSVSITYDNLHNEIKINNKIFLDDGLIKLNVIDIKNNLILCKVLNSGILGENKGINIIGIKNNIPYIRNKDKEDLIFCCNNKVDFIAISFVRNYKDVLNIRNFLKDNNGDKILIISKIENKSSLNGIDRIIKESDGLMIARGDLGINIPIENVIFEQKKIINKCNLNNKPVITATHMLESMTNNSYPTRAEAGDISNSILDGTDAVMLSGETAKGKYPIESIKIMNKICIKTDNFKIKKNTKYFNLNNSEIFHKNIVEISNSINSNIVVLTNNYIDVIKIRKYNPSSIIYNISSNKSSANKLILTKGVICYLENEIILDNNIFKFINKTIYKNNILKNNSFYIFVYSLISLYNIDTISILKFIKNKINKKSIN